MFISNLLRGLGNDAWYRNRPRRRSGRRHHLTGGPGGGLSRALAVEAMEDRTLLTAYLVDTLADDPLATSPDGDISLREAIEAANTNAPFGDAPAGQRGRIVDTITFDASLTGQTIALGGVELAISDDLSLTGLGAANLTISGNHASGVFSIDAGVTVDISAVTIADGNAYDGGGIYNEGTLTVASSTLTNNWAMSDAGAIDNLGTLTVVDCVLSGNSANYGGAIVNWAPKGFPSLTITNSTLTGNYAGSEGGAVWSDGSLHITDSTFSQNSSNRYAGGIWNGGTLDVTGGTFSENSSNHTAGGIWNEGTLEVTGSTFSDNSTRFNGGAIANRYEGSVTVDSSTFSGNSARNFGAAIDNYSWGGALDISNSVFEENSTRSVGGAIYNFGPANITDSLFRGNSTRRFGGAILHGDDTMTISACTFLENGSGWYGGAIDNTSYGNAIMRIDSSTFSGNFTGERGGAIENYRGTLEITNSTISGNSSGQVGGGISNRGVINVTNSTIFGNRADADGDGSGDGGGLYNYVSDADDYPAPLLNNTILAGNVRGAEDSDHPDDIFGAVDPASSHNLIGDAATAGGLIDGVNGNIVGSGGSGTIDIASVLDPNLADNGGPTLTHALVPGSLAFNAGDNSKAVDADGHLLVYDQRGEGFARAMAGTVDIGAFEFEPLIDVKPGSDANSINLDSNGVIAVAIFTTEDFDASQVDASTVAFAGAGAVHGALEDVDGDGYLDMVLHFQLADTNLAEIYGQLMAEDLNEDGVLDANHQTVAVSLTGLTTTDEYFEGFDEVDLFLSGKNLGSLLEDLAAAGAI